MERFMMAIEKEQLEFIRSKRGAADYVRSLIEKEMKKENSKKTSEIVLSDEEIKEFEIKESSINEMYEINQKLENEFGWRAISILFNETAIERKKLNIEKGSVEERRFIYKRAKELNIKRIPDPILNEEETKHSK